jgi:hypothetical protein
MKLSLLTTLALSWTYGTVTGLLLPHGPLALVLAGLLLLALTGAARVVQRALTYQLALADFRHDLRVARRLAAHISGGYSHATH